MKLSLSFLWAPSKTPRPWQRVEEVARNLLIWLYVLINFPKIRCLTFDSDFQRLQPPPSQFLSGWVRLEWPMAFWGRCIVKLLLAVPGVEMISRNIPVPTCAMTEHGKARGHSMSTFYSTQCRSMWIMVEKPGLKRIV